MFIWDEKKRQANLVKHNLDFVDAYLVYDNPGKLTQTLIHKGEQRHVDTAIVEVTGACLTPSTPIAESTSASSPSGLLPGESGTCSSGLVSQTNWEYIRWMQENDIPIPYDPNDPDETPYDPNDDAAVDAFWDEGERLGLVTRGLTSPPGERE